MKELSIEEKAKAYDDALEKASKLRVQNPFDNVSQMMEYVFPNLKEDEDKDEKIRKELIDYLIWLRNFREGDYAPSGKYDINNMIAWLENQKEFVSANFEDVWETADCEKLTVPLEKYEMEAIKKLCHAWYDKGIELERKKGVEKQVNKEYALKSTNHEDVCKFKEYLERRAEVYDLNLPNRSYDIYAFAKELLAWFEKHDNTDVEQVFRPLAGCEIDTAAEQAVEQQNQGKNVVLAFNGCYIPVENKTANAIAEEYEDWLEKQSDIASYESAEAEKQEFVDAGFIKCYTDFQDFKEGKTYWLEYIGNDNYNVRSDNLLGKTYHITPCQLYTIFKKQPWSEAQDELTPNPYSGVGFNDNGNAWGMCARDNGVDILFNGKLIQHISSETQDEEKPVYTPSFNVDDFIANEYCTGKVVELTNDAYLLDTGQGIPFSCHSTHLWSIKDAKDGDVLVNWDNTAFIFKTIEDETVKFHIAYNEKWDAIKTPSTKLSHLGLPEPQFEFHPATKEQRDTLMKAMADAGYEWNAEKKKLQKIEKMQGNKMEPKFKVKYHGNEYNVVDIRSSVGIISYGIEYEPNHIVYVQAQNCESVDDYAIKENGAPYPTKPVVFSEQTPADQVVSKFHEGDWVVQDHTILKIKSVRSPHYCFETVGGYVDNMLISEIDSQFHLWSIEDAKDGDMLAFDDDTIVIFKNLYNKTSFHSYCHIDEGIFETSKDDNPDWWDAGFFYPATNEQRNLLSQKMKEADYKWDAEKKELKKIEQEPNYCHHEVDLSNCSDEYRKAYYDGWNNCNQQHSQLKAEQNPAAWSEEDEGCYNSIIQHLKYSITNGKPETYKSGHLTDWLKSLKDRVKSQAKQ